MTGALATAGGDCIRTLGLDIGDRWIGVALSDPGGIIATPLAVLDRKALSSEVQAIVDIINERQVKRIVVGLPRSMNGTVGAQAVLASEFARRLAAGTEIPVVFRDERLSTVSARRLMREAPTRKTRKKTRDDDFAAAVILQSYLDEDRKPDGV